MGKNSTDTVPPSTAPDALDHNPQHAGGGDADDGAPRCLVVMYHYVHDEEPLRREGIVGITSKEFRAQLDQLARTWEPVSWPALYAWMRGQADIPARGFALTFDDGLADHARVVAPILDELGLQGTFFVPGIVLVGHELLFSHAVHLLISTLGQDGFRDALYQYLSAHSATDWQEEIDTERAIKMYHYESVPQAYVKYLLTMVLPLELRCGAVTALFERHVGAPARWARHWYMSWDELQGLEDRGHTVGGHGFCHEPLDRLSAGDVQQDVLQVASVLREGLGPDLRPFSYPYGRVSDAARDACVRAGFAHAMTTEAVPLRRGMDVYRMPRIDTIHVDAHMSMEAACQIRS